MFCLYVSLSLSTSSLSAGHRPPQYGCGGGLLSPLCSPPQGSLSCQLQGEHIIWLEVNRLLVLGWVCACGGLGSTPCLLPGVGRRVTSDYEKGNTAGKNTQDFVCRTPRHPPPSGSLGLRDCPREASLPTNPSPMLEDSLPSPCQVLTTSSFHKYSWDGGHDCPSFWVLQRLTERMPLSSPDLLFAPSLCTQGLHLLIDFLFPTLLPTLVTYPWVPQHTVLPKVTLSSLVSSPTLSPTSMKS